MHDSCPNRQRWIEVGLIWLALFAFAGGPAPGINEPHYLSRLKHFWDPTWAAGDIFLSTREAHFLFTCSFGWLTRLLPLEAVAWLARGMAWLLLASAWQRLSWRVAPARFVSLLSAVLLVTLIERTNFAGEWVVAGGVEAKCFAYAFVFEALAAMLARKSSLAIVLLGVAIAWHALAGGWSALVLSLIWLTRYATYESVRRVLPAIIVGLSVASIGVIPGLRLSWGAPPDVVARANQIYVFERLPHHLAPFHLRTSNLYDRVQRFSTLLLATSILGMGLWRLTRQSGLEDNSELALVHRERIETLGLFAGGSLMIFSAGCLLQIVWFDDPVRAAGWLKYYWFRLADVAVPLNLSLIVAALVAMGVAKRRWWGVLLLAISMVFAGNEFYTRLSQRLARPIPRADAKMTDFSDWVDLCDWVRTSTPQDALFLTPRHALSFKWRAARAEVATWKDIPQDAAGVVEWFARLQDIYRLPPPRDSSIYDVPRTRARSLTELGPRRLQQLQQKYSFDYLVTDSKPPLALPLVFKNESYAVYDVGSKSPMSNPLQTRPEQTGNQESTVTPNDSQINTHTAP